MELCKVAKNLGLKEEEALELIKLFLKTAILDLETLTSAFYKGNNDKVAAAAHSIKGAAITIGFKDIHEIAKKIELSAKANKLVETKEAIAEIKEKINILIENFLQTEDSYEKNSCC